MTKSSRVRSILDRHEARFTSEIAGEVGCTQPLVFRVIREIKAEGGLFDERQVLRQVSYRLLTSDEADARRATLNAFESKHRRKSELRHVREQLGSARAMIDDALRSLDNLDS